MATRQHPGFDCDFAAPEPLLLQTALRPEQSLLLADGKILMLAVDRQAAQFVLTRHLRSGRLDNSFGEHGMQRIGTEIAASLDNLSLQAEADGRVVIHGNLVDESSGQQELWRLQVMPSASYWPLAGAMTTPGSAPGQRI